MSPIQWQVCLGPVMSGCFCSFCSWSSRCLGLLQKTVSTAALNFSLSGVSVPGWKVKSIPALACEVGVSGLGWWVSVQC